MLRPRAPKLQGKKWLCISKEECNTTRVSKFGRSDNARRMRHGHQNARQSLLFNNSRENVGFDNAGRVRHERRSPKGFGDFEKIGDKAVGWLRQREHSTTRAPKFEGKPGFDSSWLLRGVSGTSLAFEAHPELQGKCKNLAFDGSAQGATRALKFKVKPNFRIAKKDCNTGAKRRRKSSAGCDTSTAKESGVKGKRLTSCLGEVNGGRIQASLLVENEVDAGKKPKKGKIETHERASGFRERRETAANLDSIAQGSATGTLKFERDSGDQYLGVQHERRNKRDLAFESARNKSWLWGAGETRKTGISTGMKTHLILAPGLSKQELGVIQRHRESSNFNFRMQLVTRLRVWQEGQINKYWLSIAQGADELRIKTKPDFLWQEGQNKRILAFDSSGRSTSAETNETWLSIAQGMARELK
ncbi:hypothetical protein B0H11DRAFT_1918299 [Mycena galericulata]|nr:hypothetical protein B0H11DRAFT_1918299 [Mycena galericulata]